MRISDWSSDVCSSDLKAVEANRSARTMLAAEDGLGLRCGVLEIASAEGAQSMAAAVAATLKGGSESPFSIGRPSGRPAYSRSEERRVGQECDSTGRTRW